MSHFVLPTVSGAFPMPTLKESALHVKRARHRSLSLSDADGGFCRLEMSIPGIAATDLPDLIFKADSALKAGVMPALSEGAMGGTYFLRDVSAQKICVVFKPSDEEPYAPNNPYSAGSSAGKFAKAYKGNIFPGFSMYRELVAYALDSGGSGVPPTQLAKVNHKSFRITEKGNHDYKLGSVQSYVRDIECSAEDMGPGMMNGDDIQRVAVLDIRLCNLDRHPGNLLVCRSKVASLEIPSKSKTRAGIAFTSNLEDPMCSKDTTAAKSCPADVGSYLYSQFNRAKDGTMSENILSSSPRSVNENGISPRTSGVSDAGKLRLVPIDHGYCLPHILHLSETNFAWLYWPQADAPLSEDLRQYILSLNADTDCETVRLLVGAAISDEYLLTLRVCTMLLQQGVEAGLSLRTIGNIMTATPPAVGGKVGDEELSPLQIAVFKAISLVARRQLPLSGSFKDQCTSRVVSSNRLKHSPSESNLLDMEVSTLNSPPRPPKVLPKLSMSTALLYNDCAVTCPVTFSCTNHSKRFAEAPFFPKEVDDADVSLGQHTVRCTEIELQLAISVDGGIALLDAFAAAVKGLIIGVTKVAA